MVKRPPLSHLKFRPRWPPNGLISHFVFCCSADVAQDQLEVGGLMTGLPSNRIHST